MGISHDCHKGRPYSCSIHGLGHSEGMITTSLEQKDWQNNQTQVHLGWLTHIIQDIALPEELGQQVALIKRIIFFKAQN